MYKALKSFTGVITMGQGEIKPIEDQAVVKDLINAGYIEEVKETKKPAKEEKPVEKKQKKATKKK